MTNKDIFEYNVQYDNDITFTEMRSIGYHLLRMITFNFEIVKNLYNKNNKIDFKSSDSVFQHAGLFYNILQSSKAIEVYDDKDFYNLCLTFKNSLNASRKFSFIANKFPDPIKCFIYFTKYLYIPVRVDVSSIPDDKQKEYARTWLSTITLLLFIRNYFIKFSTIIPTIDTYYQSLETAMTKPKVEAALKGLDLGTIENFLTHKFNPNHKTAIYFATMMKIIYNASIEIIRKFCPNYPAAKYINPNYDGSWLSPLDMDVNNQIKQIQNCIDMIN